ncbi:serine hydrolase domain-containing protein [Paenibacillus nasutitermitis]|uniref:Serine hydrolase n=1 Tax=Paenibacillus nasutitermitis TaxID=1652958 RepID=A0A916Z1W2_9BACL|nr:serine hydrolase domain-containing protein [Paenibacillus nasutitermitis]GGD72124.1 serine hydrolase [Paenibacillus nasutitermitis]
MRIEGIGQCSAMGLDDARIRRAFALLDEGIAAGVIPGAVASIGRNGQFVSYTAGEAVTGAAGPIPVRPDTLYDCASLTKIVVTLPLILMLLEEGRIRLDDPVIRFLPQFSQAGKSDVTIRHLLTHTSGLIPFTDMHSHGWDLDAIIDFVLSQPLENPPGKQVAYSDMGYIVLGHIASLLYEGPLSRIAADRLLIPLGMTDTQFCPPAALRWRIAATEWYPYEKGPRWGDVHDENAYAMGGVSGHAGLFATASDLSRYATMWLGGGVIEGRRILSPAAIGLAVRNHTVAACGGSRGLGWALKGDNFDASGDLLSAASYGHTGFTGTSIYVDPDNRITIVLLTNRVHFGRDRDIYRIRDVFHNAVAASIIDR